MIRSALIPAIALALASCGEEPGAYERNSDLLDADPLLSAALHDPLMADPDLSHRNEANAAVTVPASHALPPLLRSDDAARAAREAARLELLEGGRIPELPRPAGKGPAGFAGARTAGAMLAAAGAPARCVEGLEEGFAFAADLPPIAGIMPHGMVQVAAGSADCGARAVRYLTPAATEDVLQYHFTRARRAGAAPRLHDAPERMVSASGDGGAMLVAVREGPGGLTAVDLAWWKP
jgi:hypothetical protein